MTNAANSENHTTGPVPGRIDLIYPRGWGKICLGVRLEKQTDSHFVLRLVETIQNLRPGDAYLLERGKPAHLSANNIIRRFLTETDCDTLWFLDSDADIGPGFLETFREYEPGWEFDALQAFYTRRGWPPRPIWFRTMADEPERMVETFPLTMGASAVGLIGTHCALFRREIFTAIRDQSPAVPFDDFQWFCYPRHLQRSDETTLSIEASQLGFRLGATTEIQAGHFSTVTTGWETYWEWIHSSGLADEMQRFHELADLVARFLKLPKETVMQRAVDPERTPKQAWESISPKSAQAIRNFYGRADNNYLYDLMRWNASKYYQFILQGLEKHKPGIALVVGMGLGSEVARLNDLGWTVYGYELPGVLREFCLWRAPYMRQYPGPDFITAMSGEQSESFDLIVAIDVLEHIVPDELPAVLTTVRRLLKPGGIFYHHNNWGDADKYPMHYNNKEIFDAWYLNANDLKKVNDYEIHKTNGVE